MDHTLGLDESSSTGDEASAATPSPSQPRSGSVKSSSSSIPASANPLTPGDPSLLSARAALPSRSAADYPAVNPFLTPKFKPETSSDLASFSAPSYVWGEAADMSSHRFTQTLRQTRRIRAAIAGPIPIASKIPPPGLVFGRKARESAAQGMVQTSIGAEFHEGARTGWFTAPSQSYFASVPDGGCRVPNHMVHAWYVEPDAFSPPRVHCTYLSFFSCLPGGEDQQCRPFPAHIYA